MALDNEKDILNMDIPDEENAGIIALTDEDGNEVEFELLDLIEYNGEEYIVLLPVEEEEEDDEDGDVIILKIVDGENDEEAFVSVDSEEDLNAVFEIFKEKYKDEIDFAEE